MTAPAVPNRPRLHLIVARARNGVIGRDGGLPWRLPEDLKHFRLTTMGHAIVMGRRTWDSLGRPLPGRQNIVVTRDPAWHAEGAQRAASLDEAVALAAIGPGARDKVFVIGGAQLYAEALRGDVAAIHLTEIDADFAGDTHFPAPDPRCWREAAREHFGPAGERRFGFDFVRYDAIAMPAAARPKHAPETRAPGE